MLKRSLKFILVSDYVACLEHQIHCCKSIANDRDILRWPQWGFVTICSMSPAVNALVSQVGSLRCRDGPLPRKLNDEIPHGLVH
jgi:hypothetical protein